MKNGVNGENTYGGDDKTGEIQSRTRYKHSLWLIFLGSKDIDGKLRNAICLSGFLCPIDVMCWKSIITWSLNWLQKYSNRNYQTLIIKRYRKWYNFAWEVSTRKKWMVELGPINAKKNGSSKINYISQLSTANCIFLTLSIKVIYQWFAPKITFFEKAAIFSHTRPCSFFFCTYYIYGASCSYSVCLNLC